MKRLAQLLSVLLHPLLMPTLTYLTLLYVAPTALVSLGSELRYRLVLPLFSTSFLIPLAGVYLMYTLQQASNFRQGSSLSGKTLFIKSMALEKRSERLAPFAMTTLVYAFLGYLLLFRVSASFHLIGVVFASIALCLLLVTLISMYWKISAHSVGMGGTLGFLLALYVKDGEETLFLPILITLMLAGALMSARLYLNAHTLSQVGAGFLLGLMACFTLMLTFG
jgi:membrane-associated phospholipid phosphatase